MTLLQSPIQESLDAFRKRFRATPLRQDQNHLVYFYSNIRLASVACSTANLLISDLSLNLVAIHSQNATSFYVQSSETTDI